MRFTVIFRLWLMTIILYGLLCQTTLTVMGTGIVENETASIWMAGYGENYGFGAHALDNWEIISASLSGNSGGNWVLSPFPPPTSTYPARSVSAAGTRKAGWDTAQMFSATLYGAIRPIGPGPGSATYSYSVTADWSTSTLLLDPYQAIVPLGSNGSFALKWLDVACIWHYVDNPYWKCLDNVQTTWQHGLPTPLNPGEYTVKASTHPDDGDMRTSYLKVVEVASISATYNNQTVSSTTNTPGTSETLYVAKGATGATITITATPNPNSWPIDTPVWSGATSSGATTATFPIDVVSSTAGGTTARATCGTSAKAMKIVVVGVAEPLQYKIGSSAYANVTGPIIVVKGTKVDFRAFTSPGGVNWPSGKPVWNGGEGGTVTNTVGVSERTSVAFNEVSTNSTDYKTVTVECGNTLMVNMLVVEVKLKSIDFTGQGNYVLSKQHDSYEQDLFADTGSPINGAEWQDDDLNGTAEINDPVCYKKGETPSMTATFDVNPQVSVSISGKLRVKSGSETYVSEMAISIPESGVVSGLTWDTGTAFTGCSILNIGLSWEFAPNDGNDNYSGIGGSGTRFFVVFDTPSREYGFTAKRVAWALSHSNNSNTITECAEDIWDVTDAKPGFSTAFSIGTFNWTSLVWSFLDGGAKCDCYSLALFSKVALNIIGIGASVSKAFPTADDPVTSNSCKQTATKTFYYNGELFNARLVYVNNDYEGFFYIGEYPNIKAYPTGITSRVLCDNQTYYYLQVLLAGTAPNHQQFWVWDGNQTSNGVSVTGGDDTGLPAPFSVPTVP